VPDGPPLIRSGWKSGGWWREAMTFSRRPQIQLRVASLHGAWLRRRVAGAQVLEGWCSL
jgi:hypothetical protein